MFMSLGCIIVLYARISVQVSAAKNRIVGAKMHKNLLYGTMAMLYMKLNYAKTLIIDNIMPI